MVSSKLFAAAGLVASAAAAQTQGCIASTNGSTTEVKAVVPANTVSTSCCSVLSNSAVGDRVMMPNAPGFEARVGIPWSLSARLSPRCIILSLTGIEAASAVKALVDANSNQTCPFAVRSGGHTNWAEAANIEAGALLDLGFLNSTVFHPENKTASVEPGARWGQVYDATMAHDALVAGGRDPGVGVGGFMLGGGNSFYASAKGYACDNVANFQVVLANGSIVDANENQNHDLFSALKGGSSNMGIVIRYDMRTFPAEDLWGGIMAYPWSTSSQQIDALVDYADNVHSNPNSSAITFYQDSFNSNDTAVINVYTETTGKVRAPIFNKFLAIKGNLTDSTRVANLRNMVNELAQPDGLRDTFMTLTVKADAPTMNKIVELHRDMVSKVRAAKPTGNWTVNSLFQPIPALFGQHGVEAGGNVMGLDRFTDNLMLWQMFPAWEGADQDDLFNDLAAKTVAAVKQASVDMGTDNPFIYLNYADKTQAPLEGYGNVALDKIRAAAAKYDPNGVFQKLMPGGFKISLVNGSCADELAGNGASGSDAGSNSAAGSFSAVTAVFGACVAAGLAVFLPLL